MRLAHVFANQSVQETKSTIFVALIITSVFLLVCTQVVDIWQNLIVGLVVGVLGNSVTSWYVTHYIHARSTSLEHVQPRAALTRVFVNNAESLSIDRLVKKKAMFKRRRD